MEWRPSIEQVLVPIFDAPACGCRCCEAGQRERRGEYVLAKAGIRVLRIEGIDQQCIASLDESSRLGGIETRRGRHLTGNPALWDGAVEGLVRVDHEVTL